MNVVPSIATPEVLILDPKVFGDERGFFVESSNQKLFDEAAGRHVEFVQGKQSRSTKGVCVACTSSCRRARRVS